jgi:hypothetical protein
VITPRWRIAATSCAPSPGLAARALVGDLHGRQRPRSGPDLTDQRMSGQRAEDPGDQRLELADALDQGPQRAQIAGYRPDSGTGAGYEHIP